MSKNSILLLMLSAFWLNGCTEKTVEGDVFLTLRSGEILPVAGNPVYLLPFETEAEFLYMLDSNARDALKRRHKAELINQCSSALEFSTELLTATSAQLSNTEQHQRKCSEIASELDATHNKYLESIKELEQEIAVLNTTVADLSERRSDNIFQDVQKLRDEVRSKIWGRIGSLHHQGDYGIWDYVLNVTINNPTSHCISFRTYPLVELKSNGHIVATSIGNLSPTSQPTELGVLDASKIKDSQFIDDIPGVQPEDGPFDFSDTCEIPPKQSRSYRFEVDSPQLVNDIDELYRKGLIRRHSTFSQLPDFDEVNFQSLSLLHVPPDLTDSPLDMQLQELDYRAFVESTNVYDETKLMADASINLELAKKKLNSLRKERNATVEPLESILPICRAREQLNAIVEDLNGCDNLNSIKQLLAGLNSLNSFEGFNIEVSNYEKTYLSELASALNYELSKAPMVRTTIDGAYIFNELAKGRYLIFSSYQTEYNSGFFLEPVEVTSPTKIDLTNGEFVNVDKALYFPIILNQTCEQCSMEDFEESLLTREEVIQIDSAINESIAQEEERLQRIVDEAQTILQNLENIGRGFN